MYYNDGISNAGRPRVFKSQDQIVRWYEKFCDEIADGGYQIVPTITEFCRWLCKKNAGASRRAFYYSITKYYPGAKAEIERLTSDMLVSGSAAGKYLSPTIIKMALANWCKWTDRADVGIGQSEDGKPFEVNINIVK